MSRYPLRREGELCFALQERPSAPTYYYANDGTLLASYHEYREPQKLDEWDKRLAAARNYLSEGAGCATCDGTGRITHDDLNSIPVGPCPDCQPRSPLHPDETESRQTDLSQKPNPSKGRAEG